MRAVWFVFDFTKNSGDVHFGFSSRPFWFSLPSIKLNYSSSSQHWRQKFSSSSQFTNKGLPLSLNQKHKQGCQLSKSAHEKESLSNGGCSDGWRCGGDLCVSSQPRSTQLLLSLIINTFYSNKELNSSAIHSSDVRAWGVAYKISKNGHKQNAIRVHSICRQEAKQELLVPCIT